MGVEFVSTLIKSVVSVDLYASKPEPARSREKGKGLSIDILREGVEGNEGVSIDFFRGVEGNEGISIDFFQGVEGDEVDAIGVDSFLEIDLKVS